MDKEYLEFTALEDTVFGMEIIDSSNLSQITEINLASLFHIDVICKPDDWYYTGYRIHLPKNSIIRIKPKVDRLEVSASDNAISAYYKFIIDGLMKVKGNLSSLQFGLEYDFRLLFKDCDIINTPEFPVKVKASRFTAMFFGCKYLIDSEDIPNITISLGGCYLMYAHCINLIKAPRIHVINPSDQCFRKMFSGCKSLQIPAKFKDEIPNITSLTFDNIYIECNNLTEPPFSPQLWSKIHSLGTDIGLSPPFNTFYQG